MKKIMLVVAGVIAIGASSGAAEARPGGCLKYGVGGAIAGHFAGGHGLAGAAAGCALGSYRRNSHDRGVSYGRGNDRGYGRGGYGYGRGY